MCQASTCGQVLARVTDEIQEKKLIESALSAAISVH